MCVELHNILQMIEKTHVVLVYKRSVQKIVVCYSIKKIFAKKVGSEKLFGKACL